MGGAWCGIQVVAPSCAPMRESPISQMALIDAGEDIDYVGVSGPINFTPNGDPTTGSYGVFQFQGGQITVLEAYEIDLTETP